MQFCWFSFHLDSFLRGIDDRGCTVSAWEANVLHPVHETHRLAERTTLKEDLKIQGLFVLSFSSTAVLYQMEGSIKKASSTALSFVSSNRGSIVIF